MDMEDVFREQALEAMHDEAKDLLEASGMSLLSAKDGEVVLVMARAEWRDEVLRIIEGFQQ
jgi:hypothetical protein